MGEFIASDSRHRRLPSSCEGHVGCAHGFSDRKAAKAASPDQASADPLAKIFPAFGSHANFSRLLRATTLELYRCDALIINLQQRLLRQRTCAEASKGRHTDVRE
jgi:hypothetical protein